MEAHLHRDFNRGRTIVGVEATGQPFRSDRDQRLRQLDYRLVCKASQDDLLETVELLAYGGVEAGVRVAEEVHPPRADGVEISLAREVFEPDALAAADGDHRQVLLVILHLRTRVPNVRQVPSGVGCVAGRHEAIVA